MMYRHYLQTRDMPVSNCKGLMDYEGVYLSSKVTYKFEVSIMLRSSDGIDVRVRIWGHC